jgi:uncharacterized SAM-binding protein YcdF (DUF218 family)
MTVVKRLIETCLSPIGIMTFLFLFGLLFGRLRRKSSLGRRMIWCGVWLYLVFLLFPIAEILIANLERPFPPVLRPDAGAGVRHVVVLSGYGEDHSFLPATSKLAGDTISRMAEGIRLYRMIPGARLIVSGGVVREEDGPIARLMAEFAREMGVPDRDIVMEEKSTTTYENLAEVKKAIGSEPFLLVTTACDLRRAAAVARKLGMKPQPAPAAIWAAARYPAGMSRRDWIWRLLQSLGAPATKRLTYLQWAYHEYAGYLWYRLLGRV